MPPFELDINGTPGAFNLIATANQAIVKVDHIEAQSNDDDH
jgi:hypothetical protein